MCWNPFSFGEVFLVEGFGHVAAPSGWASLLDSAARATAPRRQERWASGAAGAFRPMKKGRNQREMKRNYMSLHVLWYVSTSIEYALSYVDMSFKWLMLIVLEQLNCKALAQVKPMAAG